MTASKEPPSVSPTDAELLIAWRDGDTKSGSELFGRHFRVIHRFFASKVGPETDDLVQRTFVGALEGAHRYRAEASVKTWLLSIARNVLRQWAWERGRRDRRESAFEVSVADLGVGPNTALDLAREQRVLVTGLQRIPLQQQTLLELYYWENLTAKQIASIFECPEGTVRGRIRKARQLLKAELDALARDPQEAESGLAGLETWAAQLAHQWAGAGNAVT